MKVTILTSSKDHPVWPVLEKFQEKNSPEHNLVLTTDKNKVLGGDILFLISCSEIIEQTTRNLYEHTLVVHASDLPKGRGWSPHIWQVLEGANKITVSLLEAEDKVDTGAIWHQENIALEGHELYDEINQKLFDKTIKLMSYALEKKEQIKPVQQSNDQATYYKKRSPNDSKLDINKSIEEQFNLLRVCDPDRFPAFFEHNGHCYKIKIEKAEKT